MASYSRDDLDQKSLARLLTDDQLAALFQLIQQASELLFDSVSGAGAWEAEFDEAQRRLMCQRIVVRMVGELFKPQSAGSNRSPTLH